MDSFFNEAAITIQSKQSKLIDMSLVPFFFNDPFYNDDWDLVPSRRRYDYPFTPQPHNALTNPWLIFTVFVCVS